MKLRELKRGTKVKLKDGTIAEFRLVDGIYCNWLIDDKIIIMGHANQDVSEYGEVLDNNINIDGYTKEDNNERPGTSRGRNSKVKKRERRIKRT